MTTKRHGKSGGIGKAGKTALSDRAGQVHVAQEDALVDGAGRTPDPRDGQGQCDKALPAPDPGAVYERVLKDMTFAGASLEPDGDCQFHPYDVAARGLRLILTASEGRELVALRGAFTPLAPLPFHVMVRAMELDWREREKRWPPDSPAELRWFGELYSRGDTIGQMVARLFRLLPCFEPSPGSERGADPGGDSLDHLLYLLAVDVWRHPECLALPPLAAPEASVPDLQKMENDDHERGFFRGVVGPRTKKPRGRVKRIRRYRTEDPTSWLQFVQPQWWLAAERLRAWLMENLKAANADRSTLDALVQNGALAVLLTGLLESTFDDSSAAREFAIRVYGDLDCFSEIMAGVGASAVPDETRLLTQLDQWITDNGKVRHRGESGRMSSEEIVWIEGFLLKIGLHWTGRMIEQCLKARGIKLSHRSIDEHRRRLRQAKRVKS